jgi:glutaminase
MTMSTSQGAPDHLDAALNRALDAVRDDRRGQVASYIPELAKADPELLAIAVCTPDGEVHTLGGAQLEFTLQSVSKPFVYGSALARFGAEAVHARAGTEPTGEAFDAVLRLDSETRRAHNPMINVGALATTALYAGSAPGKAIRQLLADLSAWAGRELQVDIPVYLSELGSGHRNRAITHLLRHVGIVEEAVDAVLDLYFQQCAVLVSCRDLAVMAATLAANGRQPS